MKTMFLKFMVSCFLIFAGLIPKSQAQFYNFIDSWPTAAEELIRIFPNVLQDGFLFTLWGGCQAPEVKPEELAGFKTEFLVNHRLLRKGKIPAHLYTLRKDHRPVVVFVPGVFGNLDEPRMLRIVKTLMKKAHVLVLPNPLGTDYLQSYPRHDLGDVEGEGAILHEVVNKSLQEMKKKNFLFDRVDLMGLSYGAFVAAVMATIDAQETPRLFTGAVTLLSPPHQVYNSMQALDQLMDNSGKLFSFHPELHYTKEILKYCYAPSIPFWNDDDMELARYLTGHLGFHSSLVESIELYQDLSDTAPWFQSLGMASHFYRQWYKDQRFIKYLRETFPYTYQKLRSNKGAIEYWLDLSRKNHRDLRVITCADDFINPDVQWIPGPHLRTLSHCGHFGMQGLSWLDQLLEALI